ncbi:PD-(D/E)XK nuclease family transposase (plasmid) [Candidatus Trichorickettsia mobilis]|uniref:Rpn family recombination-promoting nuclease/putative transposase n=1 Tax=Candidatus Trichorickettsia mobilis TaxID=1346319 RepID=UPI002B25CA78|nr:Rpn family recombination-promoting nuclease/putative transposase [Candidatus Trichorickettsia mobilis]WPY01596.1 PD-(D/E)XK nuclease family transposase [Candidatus Trichorickettsia mobilis]
MAITKFLDPKNDVAFRRIFGSEKNQDILIHFINDVLELKDGDKIKEITFLPTITVPEIAAKKQSVIDVLCKDENGVQLIIEMQVSPQEGFEKRAQYYAAKAYSRQLNKGKEEGARYIDLKAVIFIAISDNIIFKDKIFYKSDHIILDKESYAHDLKDFSFTFIELPKFKITNIDLLTNIIEKWCYFFKHAGETSEADLRKLIGSDNIIERAYEELNRFNWTEEELLTYEQETKRVMDNKAAEEYMLKQAKSEGKAEGEAKKAIEIAKNLLSQNIDINTISIATGLPVKKINELKS